MIPFALASLLSLGSTLLAYWLGRARGRALGHREGYKRACLDWQESARKLLGK